MWSNRIIESAVVTGRQWKAKYMAAPAQSIIAAGVMTMQEKVITLEGIIHSWDKHEGHEYPSVTIKLQRGN